jgi:hypothetical protein
LVNVKLAAVVTLDMNLFDAEPVRISETQVALMFRGGPRVNIVGAWAAVAGLMLCLLLVLYPASVPDRLRR